MDETVEISRVLFLTGSSRFVTAVRGAFADSAHVETRTAATPHAGIEILDDHDVDCVVTDYDLPDGNGIEFLEALREEYPELPVILRTDGGSERIASDAISAGVSAYVDRARDLARTADLITKTERLADVGGWEIDTETREVFWSDHLFDIFGIEADEEPPLDDALDIYHEADREMVAAAVDTALDAGEPFDIETRFRRPDGEIRWLRVQGVPVAENGRVETLRGAVQDVTERKHREQELERVSDILSKTEQIADVGGWELDAETQEIFWTDNLFELQGVDGDEEPPLEEALAVYHEDDRPRVADAVDAALNDGESFDIKARVRRPDDEIRWFRIQGVPVIEHGRVETVRGAVQDITERHSREQVLREMHDIISDRDHTFDEQVKQLLELGRTELGTAYGTLSEIDGDDYTFEVVVADDDSIQEENIVPVSATNCEIAASTEQTLVLGNVERDAPDQTHRTGFTDWGISCYLGAPVFVDDAVYGTFCFYDTEPRADQFSEWETTLVDLMSRWVSYELQRRQVTQQLHEQNEQLERFASIVSHDLRNPLSIIEGYVDLAVETGDVSELSRAKDAIERMDALIDDVLLLSRSDREIEPTTVELQGLVTNCWETVPTETAALSAETDSRIRADETRLKQLLENLFRNAVEHGGEEVTISVGDLDSGFYIEDDGPGVPPEKRETIFESGYSSNDDGTGLGLSIVDEIVETHGWEIRVTEGTEGGARFEITGVEIVE